MPDKIIKMARSQVGGAPRPVMLAIAGDSASGKTTLTQGLVEAVGKDRCTYTCVDDYHKFDRMERKELPFTPLHPDCNYIDIMEQHLQMLATGQPILKPVYDHSTGSLIRPEYVQPRQFIIIEGLFSLFSKLSRACIDISVFLDPPEEIRREWKVRRDTSNRGYTPEQVVDELDRRESESAEFIRPQRRYADIVVRFAPVAGRDDPPDTPLSAEVLLRPTIEHPPLSHVLSADNRTAMHLKIIRDNDGTPVDCLHVHGHAAPEDIQLLEKTIWTGVADRREMPSGLGSLGPGRRSEPLAMTQLLLLYHLMQEVYQG
ncbi:MAG: phosphoribulokinase [Mycobacteriales bacterium]